MNKSDIINSIFGACRLHSWMELVSTKIYEPIQVQVDPLMLPEAIDVLREEIGEYRADDIPVTIEDNVITFENLTREDYDSSRYEVRQYGQKV